ncbi:MAG: hypothetical protein ACJ8J3_18410, partial [Burkholderia ambifaria]
ANGGAARRDGSVGRPGLETLDSLFQGTKAAVEVRVGKSHHRFDLAELVVHAALEVVDSPIEARTGRQDVLRNQLDLTFELLDGDIEVPASVRMFLTKFASRRAQFLPNICRDNVDMPARLCCRTFDQPFELVVRHRFKSVPRRSVKAANGGADGAN